MMVKEQLRRSARLTGAPITTGEMVNRECSHTLQKLVLLAKKLLIILGAETEALRRFEKERLLGIIAEKEVCASDLAQQIKAFASSRPLNGRAGQGQLLTLGSRGVAEEGGEEDRANRTLLRELLGEIVKCNQKNHVFVEGSLGQWQELLTVCLPGTYVFSHLGQAARQPIPAKGLALNREV